VTSPPPDSQRAAHGVPHPLQPQTRSFSVFPPRDLFLPSRRKLFWAPVSFSGSSPRTRTFLFNFPPGPPSPILWVRCLTCLDFPFFCLSANPVLFYFVSFFFFLVWGWSPWEPGVRDVTTSGEPYSFWHVGVVVFPGFVPTSSPPWFGFWPRQPPTPPPLY